MKYTLEQLEGMSDKQINEAVLSLITGYPIDKAREIIATGYISKSSFCDYCNSWANMGPLIIRYQISIYSFITYWRCSSLLVKDISLNVDHENPLRAAAIVYILAKQEEY